MTVFVSYLDSVQLFSPTFKVVLNRDGLNTCFKLSMCFSAVPNQELSQYIKKTVNLRVERIQQNVKILWEYGLQYCSSYQITCYKKLIAPQFNRVFKQRSNFKHVSHYIICSGIAHMHKYPAESGPKF